MADAKRDQNSVPTLLGVSNTDGVTPTPVYVDPVTHRLLVDIGGTTGGTVTDVSIVSANGFAGSVATSTTTPAITLTTTITGLLKGNGTAISAATANTDYQSPIILTTTGSSGAASFNGTTLNIPNYSVSGFVPYTGANATVNLNTQDIKIGPSADEVVINGNGISGDGILGPVLYTQPSDADGTYTVKNVSTGFYASFNTSILTESRFFTWPDSSGTVATQAYVSSTLGNYVTYTNPTADISMGSTYGIKFGPSNDQGLIIADPANDALLVFGSDATTGGKIGFGSYNTGYRVYVSGNNISATRSIEFPNADGTFVLSVNGTTPNAAGNITLAGGGDVVGPASAVDNAITRYDTTTGKLIQNSGVTLADLDGNDNYIVAPIVATGAPGHGIVIQGGVPDTNQNGGGAAFFGADGNGTGDGGTARVVGGKGGATGDGADATVEGGEGGATSGNGGNVRLVPGAPDGGGTTGTVRVLGNANFDETDNGNSSTADTINWRISNKQKSTLTNNCTFTFVAPGGASSLVLKLVQDATGSRTVTWPAAVHWSGGVAPTLTTTADKVDIICFYYDGTTYFGSAALNFTA